MSEIQWNRKKMKKWNCDENMHSNPSLFHFSSTLLHSIILWQMWNWRRVTFTHVGIDSIISLSQTWLELYRIQISSFFYFSTISCICRMGLRQELSRVVEMEKVKFSLNFLQSNSYILQIGPFSIFFMTEPILYLKKNSEIDELNYFPILFYSSTILLFHYFTVNRTWPE